MSAIKYLRTTMSRYLRMSYIPRSLAAESTDEFGQETTSAAVPTPAQLPTPDTFEKHLLKKLRERCPDFRYQRDGTFLCALTPSQASRGFIVHPFGDYPDISEKIAESYYGTLQRWTMSVNTEFVMNAADTLETVDNLDIPMYMNISGHDEMNFLTFEMNHTFFMLKFCTGVSININNVAALASLVTATGYHDLATKIAALFENGYGHVYDPRDQTIIETPVHIFMMLASLGDETRTMRRIIELIRYMCFVFVPFFEAQSRWLYVEAAGFRRTVRFDPAVLNAPAVPVNLPPLSPATATLLPFIPETPPPTPPY